MPGGGGGEPGGGEGGGGDGGARGQLGPRHTYASPEMLT